MHPNFPALIEGVIECFFYENQTPWTWRPPERRHWNLWIAVQGDGVLTLNGDPLPVTPGTLALIRPRDRIEGRSHELSGRVANFAAHFFAAHEATASIDRLATELSGRSFAQSLWLIPLLRDISNDYALGDPEVLDGIPGRLSLLLHTLAAEPRRIPRDPVDRSLAEIVHRIRSNPAAGYTVPELASACGLSTSQFTRRFRLLTGRSPKSFLLEERLRTAERMLLESDESITRIAERLGYNDLYFFSRQFTARRGISPSAFRNTRL